MRAQYTLKEATVAAVRQRAESLGINPSRLVEEYLTVALRSNAAVTLTPQSAAPLQAFTPHHGSKLTTSQNSPADANLDDIFEPEPAPRKPLGEMTDDELEDATNHAVPLGR